MKQFKRVLTSYICILQLVIAAAAYETAPKTKQIKIHGYITAITSPNSFEIEDYRITRDESVELEFENESTDVKFRSEYVRIGTELEIRGDYNEDTGELRAKKIKIDLEQFKKLKNTAVLSRQPEGLRLTDQGWAGLFFADGRRIRVEPSTKVLFKLNRTERKLVESQAKKDKAKVADSIAGDESDYQPLRSLSDIGPGVIMSYEGTVGEDGTIQASRVEFERNELEKGEANLRNSFKVIEKAPDYERHKAGELSISRVGRFKLLPDRELQEHVTRLGLALIPKYQRELAQVDPQKINFRFYVVDEKQAGAFSLANGIVVVNSEMVNLLEDDAQLASVIGHEIAHSIQEHTWRELQYHWKKRLALQIGSAVATAYGKRDLAKLLDMIEGAIRNGYSRSLENQADRLGMEYMVDAGYDPREAPRVWKLMTKRYGDARTNFFYSNHDNNTNRRSYLMLEIRNNYSDFARNNLKKNENSYQTTVNGAKSRADVDSATKSVSVSQGSRDPVVSQTSKDSLGIRSVFDQMVANAHPNPEPKQPHAEEATKTDAPKEDIAKRNESAPTTPQLSEPSKPQQPKPVLKVKVDNSTATPPTPPSAKHDNIGREMTTEFGVAESFPFAKTLADHFIRATAERKNDADTYYKLKKSGRLLEVRNHSKVRVTDAAKDADGSDVFEVRIIDKGKTVWMESKFLK